MTEKADLPNRADILFYPPYLAIVIILTALVLEWLFPLSLLPQPLTAETTFMGVVLLAGAFVLALTAAQSFRTVRTNIDPHKPVLNLATEGPYRLTRNPMYLGMILLMTGLGLVFSLDWAIIFVPALWAMLHFGVVLREEAFLNQRFGAPYEEFFDNTRRWL